jgi:hypothetical protein
MGEWTSRSNPLKQLAVTGGCAVIGLVLTMGFRDYGRLGSNAGAGFLLGLLLLAMGALGILATGRQTVVVDRRGRCIDVEDATLLGRKKRSIPFDDINSVSIGYLGKRSNYVTIFYLVLKLRNGEEYPLFAPGRFFEGASDRSTVEGWRQRLEEQIGR